MSRRIPCHEDVGDDDNDDVDDIVYNVHRNLSIRREHGLEVALLHGVGQIRNVEVCWVLLRLSGHLSLGQNLLYKPKN